ALEKARNGGGATLVECVTYRISDHTTADDASRYRSPEDVEGWKAKDPVLRIRKFMDARNIWSESDEQRLGEHVRAVVDDAVKAAEAVTPPESADMFTYTCGTLSPRQVRQMRSL
ncbi:MAG TPA: thiamine pyrophosphate-dependent enzyme, partial [Dissulfurispiraceae bacterium]|nr:thiamine pyrophosphate-dependent enzyme [Dissulfurispiraceae bacterium]